MQLRQSHTERRGTQGSDLSLETQGDKHMLQHVEGSLVRILRQLWSVQAIRRRGVGQCSQHICQIASQYSTERSSGKDRDCVM